MKYILSTFCLLALFVQPTTAQDHPKLTGHWKGHVHGKVMGRKTQFTIKTAFTHPKDQYEGKITIQSQTTLPLKDIRVSKNDSVFFYFSGGGKGKAYFKGLLKNDTLITGDFSQGGYHLKFELNRFKHKSTVTSKSNKKWPLTGNWMGMWSDSTHFKTHFKHPDDQYKGTLRIKPYTLPLYDIHTTKKDSVFFNFAVNGGGHFKGLFHNDSLIAGNFYQNGHRLKFEMKKHTLKNKKSAPKPYHHQDVLIKHDSIKIGGTLTWPKKQKTNQLVIMITGSGAQNRDEEIMGFKIFGQIVDYLTRHGIATYRYDDRGVGESTGNFGQATLDDLASDVEAIINYFTADSDHHFDTITLFGHSQGGIVAGKVAAQNTRVNKIVLMSSPAIQLSKVLDYQIKRIFQLAHFNDRNIDKTMTAFHKLLQAERDSQNVDITKKHFHSQFSSMVQSIPDTIKHQEKELIKTTKLLNKQLAVGMTTPQMKSLVFYNPANDLRKVHIPVLALFGGKDLKVLINRNRPPMQAALDSAGVSYQVDIFKHANHMYESIETPSNKNQSEPDYSFVTGFLPTIVDWLKRTSK